MTKGLIGKEVIVIDPNAPRYGNKGVVISYVSESQYPIRVDVQVLIADKWRTVSEAYELKELKFVDNRERAKFKMKELI